jgi:murein L,D-transpeptidase YafK
MVLKALLTLLLGLCCAVTTASAATYADPHRKPGAAKKPPASRNARAASVGPKARVKKPALPPARAAKPGVAQAAKSAAKPGIKPATDNAAEARLLGIYRLIGSSDTRAALTQAEKLVRDYPDFALAQLVYGDLLNARTQTISQFGNVSASQLGAGQSALNDLRTESQMRIKALRERPPPDAMPTELLRLSRLNRHAIAVDASRARLYLFENLASGPRLMADYYISVGKLGIGKQAEGDQRTPLGVYFITSQLDPKTLKDFYGIGALPINYPNELDRKRGKTGHGIWLHGTPPGQFSRPPQDSDGCVVLANPDLARIISTVAIRSTPVVIARQLHWVPREQTRQMAQEFETRLQAWLASKVAGNAPALANFYAPDFNQNGKPLADWMPALHHELESRRGQPRQIKDINLLHWSDTEETMVVTFGELMAGQRSGVTRRQYWTRSATGWKIFYEGVTG